MRLDSRRPLAYALVAAAAIVPRLGVLVYEIGRRWISPLAGLLGALAATLHPYLVWHDVHMNREILDELLAAAIVLLTLLACAVVVAPWVARNRVSVGCTTLTTDGRALWKANNPNTLRVLEHGKWIDDVPGIPGAPLTPQDAGALYRRTGRVVATNECAQMRFYRHRALDFIGNHPGEKAKLAGVAARMLWQPSVT